MLPLRSADEPAKYSNETPMSLIRTKRQFMKRETSFPDQRDAGEFGLIALVGAADTDAHILCVEKHLTGWRKIVLIENKFALKETVF